MDFEKFLNELDSLSDSREMTIQKIKSHALPVIIFGAGGMAKFATKELENFGVPVEGYCVDSKYFKPNQTFLNRPVYDFAQLSARPDKYVFVLGMNSDHFDGNRSQEFLQDTRIKSYMICPDAFRFIDRNFILNNKDGFANTAKLFDDELSRKTLAAYLKLMITFDYSCLFDVFERGFYFNQITEPAKGGIFVDCGAYRGDTAEGFINWSGGNYKKIFAVEADRKNFVELENLVRVKGYKNISLINCGVWEKKGVLTFESSGDYYSSVSDAEKNYETPAASESIKVDTLDNIIGDESADFIKMMIQGSELNALKGAVGVIKRQSPILAIAVHQNHQSLIDIPPFIKSLGDYKLYLRKHSRFSIGEFILYAVGDSRRIK